MLDRFNQLFPLWALLLSGVAFFFAEVFSSWAELIPVLLGSVMFIMGLNLKPTDFKKIALDPLPVIVGVLLQFLLMPVLALTLSLMLQLSNQLTAGMVLVGSCAGGTASNVMCYLAKGELALSVSMTLVSTLIGVIATPLLCTFYLAETIDVDTLGMLMSMLQLVVFPLVAGGLITYFAERHVQKVSSFFPSIAIVLILIIIMIVVALNSDRLLDIGYLTLLAVIAHNGLGLMGGFYLSRLFGFDLRRSQTIAIEVGMQNSGLGVSLALQYFSATAALPGALFSVWHNVSGSLLAAHWSKKRSSLEYVLEDEGMIKTER